MTISPDFTPFLSLAGGLIIGLAASLYLFTTGRIAGYSGIIGGLFKAPTVYEKWRWAFVVGTVIGGAVVMGLAPEFAADLSKMSTNALVLGGLLVGFGARLGSGCTSGHGVCGLPRLSIRSLVAVGVFMGTAVVTVFVRGLL